MKLLEKKIFIWLMVEIKKTMILVTKLVMLLKKAWNWTSSKVKGAIDYFRG
ncbi:hypothetical protein [Anaerococcus senegalensis]|uniref:hypothetical protein n=1 Tax=Anaerococcus senegalensis TaxID=1288120 RepID=UPI001651F789|nr:hypothetical protein [Anaerococcus senegalensis]